MSGKFNGPLPLRKRATARCGYPSHLLWALLWALDTSPWGSSTPDQRAVAYATLTAIPTWSWGQLR